MLVYFTKIPIHQTIIIITPLLIFKAINFWILVFKIVLCLFRHPFTIGIVVVVEIIISTSNIDHVYLGEIVVDVIIIE